VYLRAHMVAQFDPPGAMLGGNPPVLVFTKIFQKMVTIIGSEKRKTKTGTDFLVMVLQGDIEIAVSKETGKPYLTARKTSIPCTFDECIA
jgi:hypothetical protein